MPVMHENATRVRRLGQLTPKKRPGPAEPEAAHGTYPAGLGRIPMEVRSACMGFRVNLLVWAPSK